MRKVIFDSSFLIAVVEKPTTWFEDMVEGIGTFQPVMLNCVKEELEKLASGQGRRSRSARVALELAAKFARERCGGGSVDDEIASAALSSGALVATIDEELARSLRRAHGRVATLKRGRVHLD
ncbi:MAG: hypothetical protein JRM73_03390 [Nitrososphaerota archaeon]|nr:hypothetical protein [Nitrososphaerota archaeon]